MTWPTGLRVSAGALLVSAILALGAGCAPYGRLYVRVGPPAPLYEIRAVAPGPGYVWISGYQRWDGRGYYWVPGHWSRPPRPRALWVPGRWERDRRGWFFVEGHWRY